jgi:CubicO group peptidase (beta-lactamase class C family)
MKTASGVPYTIPATHEITIRDLLRHTSGLTYQWNSDLGPMYKDANVASGILPYDGTIGDSVQPLAKVPLLFNPGTRIFEPLDMKDTFFFPPVTIPFAAQRNSSVAVPDSIPARRTTRGSAR